MSSYRLGPSESSGPWFTVGRLEVTTTVAVVGVTVLTWLAWVVVPILPGLLALDPLSLSQGQVWRLLTWPLANVLSLLAVLGAFFFWYFGTELEQQLGRTKMAWLLAGIAGSLTLAALLVALLGWDGVLAGLGSCIRSCCCCGSRSSPRGGCGSRFRRGWSVRCCWPCRSSCSSGCATGCRWGRC